MNYERIILELLDRVSRLEEELSNLKAAAGTTESVSAPASKLPVRDTTRYILNGVRYGKSRLVLAIVQEYIKRNPTSDANDLMKAFDKSLQGSMGVIRFLEDVEKSYSDFEKRFFCRDDEIIHTPDGDCAVCSQWSVVNIKNIIARAKELGINVSEI